MHVLQYQAPEIVIGVIYILIGISKPKPPTVVSSSRVTTRGKHYCETRPIVHEMDSLLVLPLTVPAS